MAQGPSPIWLRTSRRLWHGTGKADPLASPNSPCPRHHSVSPRFRAQNPSVAQIKYRSSKTMKRILINQLPSLIGNSVTICGWIQTLRNQKRMQFLVLRDHTGTVQTVHERASDEQLAATINQLTQESTVEITGTVISNPAVKLGGLEVAIQTIKLINLAQTPIPLGSNPAQETRLDWRFLDLRSPQNLLIFQVQTAAEHAMRCFWKAEGFIELHSPKFMKSASESGGELFRVEYFDRYAYLAQSPQFYKQMAMAAGFD